MRTYKNKKKSRKQKGGNKKESVLIILSTNEMYPEFKPQIETLKKYIDHLSKTYTVDIAGISSKDDFSNYSDILEFKYKYINENRQLSKMCDFISEYKDKLNYDWFLRTRPEIELLDFEAIDFNTLPKDAVSARARSYTGPNVGKYRCSVGGMGNHISLKNCKYKNKDEELILDDILYVFHRNVIDKGGFSKMSDEEKGNSTSKKLSQYWKKEWGVNHEVRNQQEWFFSHILLSRGIKLNVIGINMKFTRSSRRQLRYSGNIIKNQG